jgi:hypothetical protein
MRKLILFGLITLFVACNDASEVGFEIIDRTDFGKDVGPLDFTQVSKPELQIDTTLILGALSKLYIGNQSGLKARILLMFSSNATRIGNWPKSYTIPPIVRLMLFKEDADTNIIDTEMDIDVSLTVDEWDVEKAKWDTSGYETWDGGVIQDSLGTAKTIINREDSIACVIDLKLVDALKNWDDDIADTVSFILTAETTENKINYFNTYTNDYKPQIWFLFPKDETGEEFTDTVKYRVYKDVGIVGFSSPDSNRYFVASGQPVRTILDFSNILGTIPENATLTYAELTLPFTSAPNYSMSLAVYWAEDTSFVHLPDSRLTINPTDTIIKKQVPELVTAWVDRDTNYDSGKLLLRLYDEKTSTGILEIIPEQAKLSLHYSMPPESWHGEDR